MTTTTRRTSSHGMQLGASPGKLALAAGLACTLLYVLFGGGEEPAVTNRTERQTDLSHARPDSSNDGRSARSGSKNSIANANVQNTATETTTSWPEWKGAESSDLDPFYKELPGDKQRRIAALRTAISADANGEVVEADTTLDDLNEAEQAMIFVSGGAKVAQFGEKTLTIGDEVGGYRVREISPQGVLLIERQVE